MEVFVIIVAVIAVVAALLLLVLLQIRIKKQSSQEEASSPNTCGSSMEEVAPPDPNDPYLKTGPPPYIEVMKSPERYPLSSSFNGFTEARIQVLPNSCPETRSKRSWTQLMNAIIRPDDLVPSSSPGEFTHSYASSNRFLRETPDEVKDFDNYVDEKTIDDVLPSYEEVCFAGVTIGDHDVEQVKTNERSKEKCPRLPLKLEQCPISDTIMEKQGHFVFADSGPLNSVVIDMGRSRPRTLTI